MAVHDVATPFTPPKRVARNARGRHLSKSTMRRYKKGKDELVLVLSHGIKRSGPLPRYLWRMECLLHRLHELRIKTSDDRGARDNAAVFIQQEKFAGMIEIAVG